jgi:hypothetical protein
MILISQGAAGFLKGAGRSWVNVVARPAAGKSPDFDLRQPLMLQVSLVP